VSIHDELQSFMNNMAAAYTKGDAVACAEMFMPDGELYSPYAPPARGRAEIVALHRVWTEGVVHKQLTVVDAGGSGNIAWCLAAYSEGEITGDGTSLCIFERQAGGDWLIRICSLNSSTPSEQ
jgi:ketosteroid isomerase-like protein